jgi:ABC-type lipoprotein release transport system permease subunit
MTRFGFAIRSFIHYLRFNLIVAIGIAVSTAILTGGLIVGDSVRYSLEQSTRYRLGATRTAITTGDRFTTATLAALLQEELRDTPDPDPDAVCAPLFQLQGVATADGGRLRINRMQVLGVDGQFDLIADTTSYFGNLTGDEVIISENVAERLEVGAGDFIMLRIRKASLMPMNTPFVSAINTTVSARVRVKAIARVPALGRFSLKISQTAPFNVFMSLDHLSRIMDLEDKANVILISHDGLLQKNEIASSLRKTWRPADAGLKIREIKSLEAIELYADRVFMEPAIIEAFHIPGKEQHPVLTYFVNSITAGTKQTPYSFISTLSADQNTGILQRGSPATGQGNKSPGEGGILVNDWLASDLGLIPGDTVRLEYFVPGPLRRLEEHTVSLIVEGVVPMKGLFADMNLMPELPGLSDAGHCRDWEAGIPIDLEKIRDKDEDYWDEFRGTPKAFISLRTAGELWKNRFGEYTAMRFRAGEMDHRFLVKVFRDQLDPADLGIRVENIMDSGLRAARSGVDFSQLFIALSFFILLSSIILTALLFRLNLASRIKHAGTMATWGYSNKLIRRIYLTEAGFIALLGGLPGVLLAILYTRFVFTMLERVWSDIVRTSILEISIQPLTLLTGFLVCILISWLTIYIVLQRNLRKEIVQIQRSLTFRYRRQSVLFRILPGSLAALICAVLVLSQVFGTGTFSEMVFMMAGGFLFISFIFFADQLLRIPRSGRYMSIKLSQVVQRNIAGNRQRSLTIILLFALGTFSVVLTGANRRNPHREINKESSGTGGFQYFAESTIPILHDLNDPEVRYESGLEGDYSFVQFRKNDGDDASCLNLNRVSNPVLLGVDPALMEGRFSFMASTPDLDPARPWGSLEKELDGGLIPAIADQTVIQWGLGKKPGDTIYYQSETGDTLRIKLIGGIAPSVLQGNMVIADRHFLRFFPSSSGASVYLVHVKPEASVDPQNDLTRAFRDNGWYMTGSAVRLAEFESVQNTYLSIFTLLGILALILGTVGLGIVLIRNIIERASEIGLFQAMGFGTGHIFRIFFLEYFFLIGAGILAGSLAAILATLPGLLSLDGMQAFTNIGKLLLLLIGNSVCWISIFILANLRQRSLAALNVE